MSLECARFPAKLAFATTSSYKIPRYGNGTTSLLRASIEASITTTNNRTRLQLISNGKQVQALYHSRQSEIREEEKAEEHRRRERDEEVKISNLRER